MTYSQIQNQLFNLTLILTIHTNSLKFPEDSQSQVIRLACAHFQANIIHSIKKEMLKVKSKFRGLKQGQVILAEF